MLPRDEIELRAITGIGDNKLHKYGAAVLGVLKGVARRWYSASAKTSWRGEPARASAIEPSIQPFRQTGLTRRGPGARYRNTHRHFPSLTRRPQHRRNRPRAKSENQRGLGRVGISYCAMGLLESDALEVLIPDALRQRVESALQACKPEAGLRPVADALNNEVDYGLIRCVAAARQAAAGNPK